VEIKKYAVSCRGQIREEFTCKQRALNCARDMSRPRRFGNADVLHWNGTAWVTIQSFCNGWATLYTGGQPKPPGRWLARGGE
jgi:hypothetical protein